ncbi:efflux RND transporter periplasmic adaptor subunit [Methylomonas sp. OY6]|uniref:Efflux RND transporter periplasmic adaptor subunit n=2 Tax=Methylomonas defluvii TaxID=3045149 RepID=A0ABU4UCK2_9GAMM|nr:efflux RND transporter periplasmic adaptor subunit [Methylomonas sp. LW13]MDX8127205.1 efflux RND transporter periplasmic adaptor subunit [Methylomonas sp. OY6]
MNTSMPTFTRISLCCHFVLAAALLAACSDSAENKPKAPKPPTPAGEVVLAPDSPKKAYVKTAHLTLAQHPLLEPLAGKIVYDESLTSRISSPVAGRVVATPIALGTPVQTGSTLLELDSPDVADAEADFAKAQAAATLASHAFNRQQELYAGKAISRKELEQAQSDLSSARSDLQRATDRLKNLHLSARQADGRFALRATLPGIVVERNVNPGMEVRPDLDTPLFVVSDLKHLTVLLEVFEVNIGKIKLGQQVAVSVPAYPGVTFPATVQYIGQVLDETTRTVQVRCKLDNPDGRLLPGMYATISVESAADDKAFVIPLTAVFTEGDADYVFTALDDNRYRQRRVEIGLRLKDKAVITQGLDANELLVTEGALMLRAEEEVETESTHQP